MARTKLNRMSDEDAFALFVEESTKLLDHQLWKSGYRPKFSLRVHRDEPMSFGDHEPTPELLESFLLKLRPLLSQSEPIFVNRIYNTTMKVCTDQELREQLVQQRDQWKEKLAGGGVRVENRGEHLLPEDAWEAYINGVYFHRNEEERRRLLDLAEPMQQVVRYQFLQHVFDATIYVNNIGAIVGYGREVGKIVLGQGT